MTGVVARRTGVSCVATAAATVSASDDSLVDVTGIAVSGVDSVIVLVVTSAVGSVLMPEIRR